MHAPAIREEVRAGGPAVSVRDHTHILASDIHRVDLITLASVTLRLKYQLLAVSREVGFCVFSAERELFDVLEMFLLGQAKLFS